MPGPSPSTWRPLLDGELLARARTTIDSIVAALIARARTERLSPDLACGTAGIAVLLAYLDRARGRPEHDELIHELLARSVAGVGEQPMPPALLDGLTGIAWALDHLRDQLDGDDDLVADVDGVLVDALGVPTWDGHHDLVSGLAGIAVYALARMPRADAAECLRRIVAHLDALSITPEQIPGRSSADTGASAASEPGPLRTWHTPPSLLPRQQRAHAPRGLLILGAAHGVPGPIHVLARIARAGVHAGRAGFLADAGMRWLRGQAMCRDPHARYPTSVNPADPAPPAPSRSAWCYGDPGIAIAMYGAGRALDRADWCQDALILLRGAARRRASESGVVDAPLCHGATGLGHIFNRMYQATGDPALREAAIAWFGRALDMEDPGRGLAGFPAGLQECGPRQEHDWHHLLDGAAGVALALLAATSEIEPAWDRVLLMS